MINTASIIEAIYYLLLKLGPKTKLHLLKLIFLADKYHLLHYGRTVTGDEYFAMQYGPVGSTVKDVLEFDDFTLDQNELEMAQRYFDVMDPKTRKAKENGPTVAELRNLSETDFEALDHVVERYKNLSTSDLVDFTHKYPEWLQHKEMFDSKISKRERLSIEELISVIPEDGLAFSEEELEIAKELVTGKGV